MSKRIGLLGGTFNPIHLGHTALAQNVFSDFKLDELILIPVKLPPHKDVSGATALQRYEMAKLTANLLGEGFSVSDYELKTGGISYSYSTISHWSKENPEAALFFIAGSDIFATIKTWQKWREIFGISNFIVANRMEMPFDTMLDIIPEELRGRVIWHKKYDGKPSGKIILYEMDIVSVSSTKIRGHTSISECRKMLPEDVYSYIINNNLYQ
ncbi:MAG: nicotinate-nucleotide adenylyltransferase [Deferribacteraceae bacterium]|jgi:nicotinate-nucleotide adenylyltransferase|nr:nicotinate-nucleotide adenylyltransferase [Deferribacteraceae bacterium]